jgi:DNA-binding transcriptional regulator YhcF (GntR family)
VTAKRSGDGQAFRKVSDKLRERIADGTYSLGAQLPSQHELAEEFDVSRDTIHRVVQELGHEGLIDNRQGTKARVKTNQRVHSPSARASRSRQQMTLGPFISEAFERTEVVLDVYTLTSESLETHIKLQVERIVAGVIAPERIRLRMLLPSDYLTLPYPQVMGDPADPLLRERLKGIAEQHEGSLRRMVRSLQAEKLVSSVELEIRRTPLIPTFKVYLINGTEALHGLYDIIKRPVVLDNGDTVEALDVLGYGAALTHHLKDSEPTSPGSVFVHDMQKWFDSVWNLLSE